MKFIINDAEHGITIKQFMERRRYSSRLITRLKAKERGILVNGERKTVRWVLSCGEILELETEDSCSSSGITPSFVPIKVLYEDQWFIVVEKTANLPVHPSHNHLDDTLASRVMAYFHGQSFVFRALTRLDLDTSGAVIIAKDSISATLFSKLLEERKVKKEYIAVCHGIFDEKEGVIDFNIRRVRKFKMEREAVPKGIGHGENSPEGIEAVTEYSVLREAKGMSLVRFIPVTGRTHQLRVHARAIGHPIIGDSLYSSPSPYISRQALHAERLSFIHPMTNEAVSVVCPLCEDLDICVKELFDE